MKDNTEFRVHSSYKNETYYTDNADDALEWYEMWREYGDDTVELTVCKNCSYLDGNEVKH